MPTLCMYAGVRLAVVAAQPDMQKGTPTELLPKRVDSSLVSTIQLAPDASVISEDEKAEEAGSKWDQRTM